MCTGNVQCTNFQVRYHTKIVATMSRFTRLCVEAVASRVCVCARVYVREYWQQTTNDTCTQREKKESDKGDKGEEWGGVHIGKEAASSERTATGTEATMTTKNKRKRRLNKKKKRSTPTQEKQDTHTHTQKATTQKRKPHGERASENVCMRFHERWTGYAHVDEDARVRHVRSPHAYKRLHAGRIHRATARGGAKSDTRRNKFVHVRVVILCQMAKQNKTERDNEQERLRGS